MTDSTHGPNGEVWGEWCFSHGRNEPGDGYLRCGECFHLFQTPGALELAHSRPDWEGNSFPMVHASMIRSCPECAHDF